MRKSGIILHPTSLPGDGPIGDLGPQAYRFIDWLQRAGQGLWQVLPLVPPGWGYSPYQSTSAFATNVLLVAPEPLEEEGLLPEGWSADNVPPDHGEASVDFSAALAFKEAMFTEVMARFEEHATAELREAFTAFMQENADWLEDYALFTALYRRHDQAAWNTWPAPLARREPEALAQAREELSAELHQLRVEQFLFRHQWDALHRYAQSKGIRIVGDIPIFVDHNSADVWSNPALFRLQEDGSSAVVAGVPPDYFAKTGQLWGNPLYRWEAHHAQNYAWWIRRMKNILSLVDVVRIDHFRGFESYWEIPAGSKTAVGGRWVKGPGRRVFDAIRGELGDLPIIAEDLGIITPAVTALRESLRFPGMRVLHFAFSGEKDNTHLPHNYEANTVAYPGTHDNDTTHGWYRQLDDKTAHNVRVYLSVSGQDIAWDLIKAAWFSVAGWALCNAQDLLKLDSWARMNTPGTKSGNWSWRLLPGQLDDRLADGLRAITAQAKRG